MAIRLGTGSTNGKEKKNRDDCTDCAHSREHRDSDRISTKTKKEKNINLRLGLLWRLRDGNGREHRAVYSGYLLQDDTVEGWLRCGRARVRITRSGLVFYEMDDALQSVVSTLGDAA